MTTDNPIISRHDTSGNPFHRIDFVVGETDPVKCERGSLLFEIEQKLWGIHRSAQELHARVLNASPDVDLVYLRALREKVASAYAAMVNA